MRAVVQRVSGASVSAGGERLGGIGVGLVVLLGVARGDSSADADWMANKVASLRVFPGASEGAPERSVAEAGGAVLAVSQFTLLADCRKGRRPSFSAAAPGPGAEPLYRRFVEALRKAGLRVETGKFAADMVVGLENSGPYTLIIESRERAPEPERSILPRPDPLRP